MIGIQAIKPYLDGRRIPVAQLPGFDALPPEEKEYFLGCGIEAVRKSPSGSYALARGAAERLLADAQIEASQLDLLIYIKGRIPEQLVSSEATRLKDDLGATKAMVCSVTDLGCADSSMALKMAVDHLTANRRARHALICYGHHNPEGCRFRYPVTVQGDGGVACLLQKGGGHPLLDFAFDFNGAYWDLFKIDYAGQEHAALREVCRDLRAYGFELAVESRLRFQECNQRLLERRQLRLEAVDHLLLQNISSRAFDVYTEFLGVPISPVCRQNLNLHGHLGCADILLNLQLGLETGLFAPGQSILVMNNSPAAAWSSFLLEIGGA